MQPKKTMILLVWVYWFDFARFYKTECTIQLLCFLVISKSMDVGGSQSKREWVCQVKRGVSERQPVRTHFSDFLFFPHRGFVLHPTQHRDNLIPAWFGGYLLRCYTLLLLSPHRINLISKKPPFHSRFSQDTPSKATDSLSLFDSPPSFDFPHIIYVNKKVFPEYHEENYEESKSSWRQARIKPLLKGILELYKPIVAR